MKRRGPTPAGACPALAAVSQHGLARRSPANLKLTLRPFDLLPRCHRLHSTQLCILPYEAVVKPPGPLSVWGSPQLHAINLSRPIEADEPTGTWSVVRAWLNTSLRIWPLNYAPQCTETSPSAWHNACISRSRTAAASQSRE
jgi:hypothetical protein